MYDAVRANNLENRRLESLRDSLLPKLMTGEIDVSKIDLTQLNSHLAKCFMFAKWLASAYADKDKYLGETPCPINSSALSNNTHRLLTLTLITTPLVA